VSFPSSGIPNPLWRNAASAIFRFECMPFSLSSAAYQLLSINRSFPICQGHVLNWWHISCRHLSMQDLVWELPLPETAASHVTGHWNLNYNGLEMTFCTCIHSFIHQWLYSPFQFRNIFYTNGRTPWTSDQHVARPLPAQRTTQTQNKNTHRHLCLEWDSNPRSQRSSERRQFMP
jgi:hypothetical protein